MQSVVWKKLRSAIVIIVYNQNHNQKYYIEYMNIFGQIIKVAICALPEYKVLNDVDQHGQKQVSHQLTSSI